MSRVGGLTSKYYRETRGIKVTGGQTVKAGTVLTRDGHRWRAGRNVTGLAHLNAVCDGEVYFTSRKNKYGKMATYVNIRPVDKA